MVAADSIVDFLMVVFHVLPCGFEVENTEAGIILEQIEITHTGAARLFEHPHGNPRRADAGLASADTGGALGECGQIG